MTLKVCFDEGRQDAAAQRWQTEGVLKGEEAAEKGASRNPEASENHRGPSPLCHVCFHSSVRLFKDPPRQLRHGLNTCFLLDKLFLLIKNREKMYIVYFLFLLI